MTVSVPEADSIVTTTAEPPALPGVLVVDDHPTFRFGIVELLSRSGEVRVAGEAADSSSAMEAFRRLKPDVVVMDITLPGRDGIELTKMMKAEMPKTSILIVSMHDELLYGLRALRAGACGYLRKNDAVTHLAEAMRHVVKGEYYLSPKLRAYVVQQAIHAGEGATVEKGPLPGLSDREMEVFQWLGRGLGTRQIAEQLGLSIKTIETHRAHIKTKLSLGTADEMVKLAREWQEMDEMNATEYKLPPGRNQES